MTTKAEAMVAMELVSKAVTAAAAVVAAINVPSTPPAISEPQITQNPDGSVTVVLPASVPPNIKWSLVYNNEAAGHPWYGLVNTGVVPPGGLLIKPQYTHDGDFVKLNYGANLSKWMDGPKNTKAVVPAVPISGDIVRKVIAKMHAGMNQERMNFLSTSINGAKPTEKAYYDYYATTCGTDWHRFFVPMNFDVNRGTGIGTPTDAQLEEVLNCAIACVNAGYPVVFGASDVLGDKEVANWQAILDFTRRAAKRVKEKAPNPSLFLMETTNEMAGEDNAYWNKYRIQLGNVIREELGTQYGIIHGGAYWNAYQRFTDDWEVPTGGPCGIQYHTYETNSDWSGVNKSMRTFAASKGLPIICGELQCDFGKMSQSDNQGQWADNFVSYGKGWQGIPAAAWANIGGQNDFRMNRSGSDGRLSTPLEAAMKTMSETMKTRANPQ